MSFQVDVENLRQPDALWAGHEGLAVLPAVHRGSADLQLVRQLDDTVASTPAELREARLTALHMRLLEASSISEPNPPSLVAR